MKYYKDQQENIHAYCKEGFQEIESPIFNGKVLKEHKYIDQVEIKEDHTYATYYNQDGTIDWDKENQVNQKNLLYKYKNYYLEVFETKLHELDYDSIATVQTWIDDIDYGAEAKSLLDWYKALTDKNYQIINSISNKQIEELDKDSYIKELPKYEEYIK